MQLSQFIDHTLLDPTATPSEITTLCEEAITHQFYGVCVPSCYVYLAVKRLEFEPTKVVATIGFPLGSANTASKIEEAKKCIEQGADEIDMVINIGFFKGGLTKSVREEISSVKKAIGNKVLKVIVETCYLTKDEKSLACKIVENAGADYIKTSTGFGPEGAKIEDVILFKELLPSHIKIKAYGGIKTGKDAITFIANGASRIGNSNGIYLLKTQ